MKTTCNRTAEGENMPIRNFMVLAFLAPATSNQPPNTQSTAIYLPHRQVFLQAHRAGFGVGMGEMGKEIIEKLPPRPGATPPVHGLGWLPNNSKPNKSSRLTKRSLILCRARNWEDVNQKRALEWMQIQSDRPAVFDRQSTPRTHFAQSAYC